MGNYAEVKKWRKKNKDKVNAQARRYRAKHPDKTSRVKKTYRLKHLEEVRERDAKAKRNWRLENPNAYYAWKQRIREERKTQQEEEAGRICPKICDICKREDILVYDHCHAAGNFRGWICHRCNRVLGSVYDDVNLLKNMISYLQK